MIESQRFEKAEKCETKKSKKLRKIKELESENWCYTDDQNLSKERSLVGWRPGSVPPVFDFSLVASKFLPLKKFHEIYSKIVVQLETVKNLSENKSNEADNLLELRRQLQRADEFSIRFSRNNLYETKRLISEIKKLIEQVFPMGNHASNECKLLCKKIIMSYQAASQSLQMYINYVKNPFNLEVPEKINELVLHIADLFLCCEHLSLPPDLFSIQNTAVKICNELLAVLKSKISSCVLMTMKEEDVGKKKSRTCSENSNKIEKLSMYKSKLTIESSKGRGEPPGQRKKFGISCLLGNKARRMKKRDEKKARMTHEIYTQKMYPRLGKPLTKRDVQFEVSKSFEKDKSEHNMDGKPRRNKFFTPREVKCQDDDVETMVQAIGDDDIVTSRIEADESREAGEISDTSSTSNKLRFRELLLEAIEDLQNSDKKEQKATLKKLLTSIQNCSKNQRPPNVTVFHFKSRDLEEESQKTRLQDEVPKSQSYVDLNVLNEKIKAREEMLCKERRLNIIFGKIKLKKSEEAESEKMAAKGKINLKLSEESIANANKYRKYFAEYRRSNIMYKKTQANKPWELVGKVSDHIVLDIIKDISMDFENDAILRRLYFNELLEVIN